MAIIVCRMNTAEYLKLAEVEDRMWYFRSLHGHVERELAHALPAGREARVLDAGCGTGGLILRLRERHPAWTLIVWGEASAARGCRHYPGRWEGNPNAVIPAEGCP